MPGDTKSTQHQTSVRKPLSVLTLTWAALLSATALLIAVECGNSPMNVHLRELYRHYQQQEQQQQQQKQQQQLLTNRYASRPCPENLVLKTDPSAISTPTDAATVAAAAAARQPIECLEKIKGNEDDYYIDKDNSDEKPNALVSSNDGWWQEYFAVKPGNTVLTQTDTTLGNSGAADAAAALAAAAASLSQPTAYLPAMHYNDFYEDLVTDAKSTDVKRGKSSINCDCKVTNDLKDLGHQYFPRYLLNAVCQTRNDAGEPNKKCWRGANCKPLEYKIKVLTLRNEHLHRDTNIVWLPDNLRHLLSFKTITVTAGCFCAN